MKSSAQIDVFSRKLSPSLLNEYLLNLWKILQSWAARPWFAYLTIVLLQLKRIWGAWQYRDLTSGDTSFYFVHAFGWAKDFSSDIEWSPLYTAFYGIVFKLVPDVYWATLLHRLVIVFALAILVLALMRRLLPPQIAWLIAAWWVILPVNFNTLYEVHLFSVLLPLISILVVLYKSNVWTRGGAFGVLLASTLLIRNEVIIALCLWGLICLAWEIRQIRLYRRHSWRVYLLAYGLPFLFAILAFTFFYWRTTPKPTQERLSNKHTLNVCQIYAFGYQQRHSDWNKNPWTECQDLMLRVFGSPQPSLIEAFRSNPRAILGHFLWNIRLLPAGLQVALFNATSDSVDPDYPPVLLNKTIVLIPSLLVLGSFILGSVQLYRESRFWWFSWLKDRIWGWIMMFCIAAVMGVVIPMQRPRPSYMFMLTLLLMAVFGMCLFLLTRRILDHPWFVRLFPVVVIIMVLFSPSFYSTKQQPLLKYYRELESSEEFIGIPGTGFVIDSYSQEFCNYFTKRNTGGCVGFNYSIFQGFTDSETVSELLDRNSVPVVALFVDDKFLDTYEGKPAVQNFLAYPEREGWKLVAFQNNSAGRWRLYVNVLKLNIIDPGLQVTLSDK